jgi:lipopolysaccharide/colanic/teichoic acid biosynthesis glycosyltransferase
MKTTQQWFKRLFDILGSLFILIVLSPFLALVSLAIAIESPGGIFFTQMRVGQNGRPFRIYKFRSMLPHKVDYQHLKEVDGRNPNVTPFEAFLRRYGIDELPQFLNILLGDMSFFGPRPTIQEQVDRYTPFQRRRLAVRPGLSGLAQVSGNTSLSWKERIILDVWYIENWSLWLDFRIALRTIGVIFKGQVMGQVIEYPSFLPITGVNEYTSSGFAEQEGNPFPSEING